MKKKILLIILTFLFSYFLFNESINAEITYCSYRLSSENLEVNFTIENNKISKPIISGSINKKHYILPEPLNQYINNWDSTLDGTSFIGSDYYTTNKVCPPHLYLLKIKMLGFIPYTVFYVSDQAAGGSFEAAIRNKFNLVDGFPKVLALKGSDAEQKERDEYLQNLPSSCMTLDYDTCEKDPYFSCLWNETEYGNYCNTDNLLYIACGDAFDIPYKVPELISFLVNLLKIATPIILIFMSVITLLKAITSQKEEEMKKAQNSLIKKIIAAVMIFFVISIVQFVILKVADSNEKVGVDDCLSCFLNNKCDNGIYYKTNVGGTYLCKYVNGDVFPCKGNK